MGFCNPTNGVCLPAHRQENTPCVGGICLAGGCYIEVAPSSSSGSGSGVGGSSATGSAGTISLHGGACGIGGGSTSGAPWVGLGLLLALRRRRQSASSQRAQP